MATHSSILALRIPWTEETGGPYSPWGCKELDTTDNKVHTHSPWFGDYHHQNGLSGAEKHLQELRRMVS